MKLFKSVSDIKYNILLLLLECEISKINDSNFILR